MAGDDGSGIKITYFVFPSEARVSASQETESRKSKITSLNFIADFAAVQIVRVRKYRISYEAERESLQPVFHPRNDCLQPRYTHPHKESNSYLQDTISEVREAVA